jgi:hypothetical protein
MKLPIFIRFLVLTLVGFPVALVAIDTDQDGLDDSVETSTGIYVSPTNSGSSPTNPDTDGDGAGDWYEVAASLTDPNHATSKPNVPYPLPAPDASTGATNKPVKVFILSGQSNMEGQGNITPRGTAGTLETITKNEYKFPNLLNGANWSSRNDVRYRGVVSAIKNQLLTAGQGTTLNAITAIGPELGFGHVMGYFHGEPVLVLKSAEGGKSLGGDFLPPGSVPYNYTTKTYPGFGQSPISWVTGSAPVNDPNFYGGIQFDKCFRAKADWAPAGAALTAVPNVTDVLDNFATEYPQWAAQGFEIAGFAWFHGWNDGLSYTGQYAYRYEQNMAQFIRQIRAYYENRYPGKIKVKAPFAIATAGFEGFNMQELTRKAVFDAQINVGNPTLYPEFAGNVKTMDTRSYWRDKAISPVPGGTQGFHYNRNAETYMLVGDALGRGMIDLINSATPDTAPPAILTLSPKDNATGVPVAANLILTFNEGVLRGSGNITLKNLSTGTQLVIPITDPQISVSGAVLTLNPTANLAASANYAIQIDPTAFVDLATNPFPGINNDTTWNFTTAAPDAAPPTPSPLTWALPPAAATSSSIIMTATTASDPNGVEYWFENTSLPGRNSGWQNATTWTDSGLLPSTSYTYTVKARDKSADQNETAASTPQSATTNTSSLPVVILSTDFTGRTVVGATATVTDYALNGVAAPGALTAVRPSGSSAPALSALFTTTAAQGYFAPTQNPAHWQMDVPLAVGSATIDLANIVVKFQSFSSAGALKTQSGSGDTAADHWATVSLLDASLAPLRSQQIAATTAGTRATWTGTFTAAAGLALQANTSYTLRILISGLTPTTAAASGNHVGIDALTVNGVLGGATGDTSPPTPDPMTFELAPVATGTNSITMRASTATDPSAVEYFFENATTGEQSGWQADNTWNDTGLAPATTYAFRVTARDQSAAQNSTAPSSLVSATTDSALAGGEILATRFTSRTIAGATATITDYTLNGLANPGALTVLKVPGSSVNVTGFFTTPDAAGHLAVQTSINSAHWRLDVPLNTNAAPVTLGQIELDLQSFTSAGAAKPDASSVTAHWVTVELLGSAATSLGSQQVQSPAVNAHDWTGIFNFASGITLQASQSYTLRILVSGLNPASPAAAGNYVGLDALRIFPTLAVSPFASWQQTNFPGITDPAVIGETADPDRDGSVNLLEYALNTDPKDPSKLTSLQPTVSATELSLRYTRVAAATDITYLVEWSPNLATWFGTGVIETLDPDPPTDPAYPRIKARVSKGPDPVKFLRLRIVK